MLNLITALAMVIVTTLLIGWDIWVVTHGGKTISNYMMNVGREFMTAPFAWGMLGGHFFAFHFRNFDSSGQIWRSLTLAGAGIVILLWDVWMQFHPFPAGSAAHWLRYPFVWFLIGTVAGWGLFPQTSDFNFEYLRRH